MGVEMMMFVCRGRLLSEVELKCSSRFESSAVPHQSSAPGQQTTVEVIPPKTCGLGRNADA